MFNKKQREIERLNKELAKRDDSMVLMRNAWNRDLREYRNIVDEYEKTNLPSYDMNVLFAAVVDYKKILVRLCAPDPVIANAEVKRVFDKYRIKL